jgi:hypothetical protein
MIVHCFLKKRALSDVTLHPANIGPLWKYSFFKSVLHSLGVRSNTWRVFKKKILTATLQTQKNILKNQQFNTYFTYFIILILLLQSNGIIFIDFPQLSPSPCLSIYLSVKNIFCLFVYLSVNSVYFPHLHHVLKCCDGQN